MGGRALVLGNGESRLGLDLKNFSYDTLIGCNAVYRDFSVDYLICCDKRTVQEAIKHNIKNVYTREEWADRFNVNKLPELPYTGIDRADQPQHWGSGVYAVLLAIVLGHKEIELVGFDLYGIDNKVNNVYKGTENYSNSDSHSVDYSYWVYQLSKLFEIYPEINFKIKNKPFWIFPDEWKKNNVVFVAI